MTLSTLLFITSFIPTIVFKIIARMGDPTLSQAKTATIAGLTLAILQMSVSHRVLKKNSYLEWAFIGFLCTGAVWVFAAPLDLARLYVTHNTALLYFILFLMTLLPQLFGFDPFTYTIAKRWQPESTWKTPQFRTINLHITCVFAVIMLCAFISNVAGHGKPLYSIIIPFILILGIGIPFSRLYPKYYISRQSAGRKPQNTADFPDTIKDLILNMPRRFNQKAAKGVQARIQYIISGPGGGNFALSIKDGTCFSHEGIIPDPQLTVTSPAKIWMDISKGTVDPATAFMEKLYSVDGDMTLLMNLRQYFNA